MKKKSVQIFSKLFLRRLSVAEVGVTSVLLNPTKRMGLCEQTLTVGTRHKGRPAAACQELDPTFTLCTDHCLNSTRHRQDMEFLVLNF